MVGRLVSSYALSIQKLPNLLGSIVLNEKEKNFLFTISTYDLGQILNSQYWQPETFSLSIRKEKFCMEKKVFLCSLYNLIQLEIKPQVTYTRRSIALIMLQKNQQQKISLILQVTICIMSFPF